MNTHPLQFFKELAENSQTIDKAKDKFYSSYPEEMILELDRERESIKIMNPFDSESLSIVRYFHHYFKEACYSEMDTSIKAIEVDILKAGDTVKEKNYLKKVIEQIDLLISTSKERVDLQKYPFISSILESTKEFIQGKYNLKEKNTVTKQVTHSTPKIQWLGKTNILTTLFNDLLNGIRAEGIQPLINSTPKEIEKLIVENFIDQEGKEFQMDGTIGEYLKASRQSTKRAKGGISIEIKRND